MKIVKSTTINSLTEISLDKAKRSFLSGQKVYKSGNLLGTTRVLHINELNGKEIWRRFYIGN